MTGSGQLLNTASVLSAYQGLIRDRNPSPEAACDMAVALRQINRPTESRKCYKIAVEILQHAARQGNVYQALLAELALYEKIVKTNETEEHYYRCFSDWREDMVRLGKRFRSTEAANPTGGNGIGFILLNGHILGHTEVMFQILAGYRSNPDNKILPRIYVISGFDEKFLERAKNLGIEVILVTHELPNAKNIPFEQRFLWVRDKLRTDRCDTMIWVSTPFCASFALAMRLAPVQIFWALRFHPLNGPHIDGYITYGSTHESERVYGNQRWGVCPVPLTLDNRRPAPDEITAVRAQFSEKVLLGTLAREEKIASAPFLSAVSEILKANPHTAYLWTGREKHPIVQSHFETSGVAERCHFIGWVDTALYAEVLDLFLETFPFGCGITGYQALRAGTPLLSYLEENTIFGMQFWHEVSKQMKVASPDIHHYPVLCARDRDEYVSFAGKLISDIDFRQKIGLQGQHFYQEEVDNLSLYSQRFFDTVENISKATIAARANAKVT